MEQLQINKWSIPLYILLLLLLLPTAKTVNTYYEFYLTVWARLLSSKCGPGIPTYLKNERFYENSSFGPQKLGRYRHYRPKVLNELRRYFVQPTAYLFSSESAPDNLGH